MPEYALARVQRWLYVLLLLVVLCLAMLGALGYLAGQLRDIQRAQEEQAVRQAETIAQLNRSCKRANVRDALIRQSLFELSRSIPDAVVADQLQNRANSYVLQPRDCNRLYPIQ